MASWYGGVFQGKTTANGEIYDTHGYTCAHRTLPFGTILTVENLSNGKFVQVRVNDRGPFVDNRIIDLTYAAARDLDMIRDGTAPVRLLAQEDQIPPVRFTVRIGAWGNPINALTHRQRLEEARINPRAELGGDGITRIFVPDVQEKDVFPLVSQLEKLGYENLQISQIR